MTRTAWRSFRGPAAVTVGRLPLWWGPARHGSLLVSNNAAPFDLVRVATAEPHLLPGWLTYLGLLSAEVFLTRLKDERTISKPYFAGVRVHTRVNPYVELGASRTAVVAALPNAPADTATDTHTSAYSSLLKKCFEPRFRSFSFRSSASKRRQPAWFPSFDADHSGRGVPKGGRSAAE